MHQQCHSWEISSADQIVDYQVNLLVTFVLD